jgi:acyl transferase domain-containing protein/acyl carrier protein
LLKQSDSVFLEVGPGKTLGQFVQVASQSRKNERKPRAIISGMSAGTRERPDRGESAGLLESLGRLWTLGVSISWSGFYQAERRRRVSLPTYPFERQEYCLEPGWGKAAVRTDGARHKMDDWFYLPSWKRSLAPAIAPADESLRAEVRTCILFTDRNSAGNDLGAKLEEEKWQVVWVSAAREFQKIDPLHFAIRPGSEEDWMLLLHELKNVGPQKIAHFWNAAAEEDSRDFEESMDRSFYSLLYLAKSIGAQSRDGEISILVVSTGAHAVEGGDRPDPFKAPLLGPCRILPQEFPGIRCANVDVPLTREGSSERQRVVEQLLREFRGTASDPVVAYRGRHRWVQSWESTHIEQDVSRVPLRDNGVYLITGGLGGIGLELADSIASAVKNPRVALLGRTPFPDRNQWGSWLLEHVASDPTCEKIRRIQKLEAKGAVVQVVQGDVSSKTDVERIREEIAERHRKVHGIVHAAGVAGGGLLQLRGRPEAARVLAPKIQGTLYLHELFPDLDFLVLCSSVTAVLGGIGQADYCAANAFMDAFAVAHSEQRNQRILSVNWDAWQEVGMAVHTVVPREWKADLTSSLQEAIKPVEGKAVFEMVLGAGLPQLVVSTHDFPRRVREAQATQLPRAADVKMPGTRYARPDSAGPYEAPNGDLEIQLAGVWSEVLGIEPVGRNDNFFELGGHSLLAIQLISRVREVFRIEVRMGSVFENTTPASFAQMLLALESQPGEMEQIAQIVNAIGAMSESQLMEALEQGRLGATQT